MSIAYNKPSDNCQGITEPVTEGNFRTPTKRTLTVQASSFKAQVIDQVAGVPLCSYLDRRPFKMNLDLIEDPQTTYGELHQSYPPGSMSLLDPNGTLTSIAHFESITELLSNLIQVVDVLQRMETLNVTHRDIGIHNILKRQNAESSSEAYLVDLDDAKITINDVFQHMETYGFGIDKYNILKRQNAECPTEANTNGLAGFDIVKTFLIDDVASKHMEGTLPYFSVWALLLINHEDSNVYIHRKLCGPLEDLESLYWVVIYIVHLWDGPNNKQRGPDFDIKTTNLYDWSYMPVYDGWSMESILLSKHEHVHNSTPFDTRQFSPYFLESGLIPFLEEWYQLVSARYSGPDSIMELDNKPAGYDSVRGILTRACEYMRVKEAAVPMDTGSLPQEVVVTPQNVDSCLQNIGNDIAPEH